MDTLFKKHFPLLHSDVNLKALFPEEKINVVFYRRNKNLKELLTPSLFPIPRREKYGCVTSYNTRDISENYMVFRSTFVFTVAGKKYYIRGNFTSNSTNVNYLVECINCKSQYVGPATSFKKSFYIHKSDIKTKTDSSGTARHFNSICCNPINPHGYWKVQLIEQVFCDASNDIESILTEHEKYWQYQLFTNMHGINSISDLCGRKRKDCRKKYLFITNFYS